MIIDAKAMLTSLVLKETRHYSSISLVGVF